MSATALTRAMNADVSPVTTASLADARAGLRMTATTATVFTVLGHGFFGFEQSLVQMVAAVLTGYATALVLETVDAKANGRAVVFLGHGFKGMTTFLMSAHMTAITTSFLIYAGIHSAGLLFAVVAAVASKYIFRIRAHGRVQHFFNPSNFGLALTFTMFQWTCVIPYGWTENFYGGTAVGDWILPAVIIFLGTRVNTVYTKRLPLIAAWLGGFILQGIIRAQIDGTSLGPVLMSMSGVGFILFTFYMITDPMTSPNGVKNQIAFGLGIAMAYTALMSLHVFFTIFYSVTIVCAVRGLYLWWLSRRDDARSDATVPVVAHAA